MAGTGTEAQSLCSFDRAPPTTLAADLVYRPRDTAFLRAARDAGLPTLGGLAMLVYQGALSFELWTGSAAPVDAMFDAARTALSRPGPPA
ncbi:MAG: hypothetical protein WEC33_07745 [Dehalococcoidia bacterium]